MAESTVRVNDPKAIKRWSAKLAVDVARESFWQSKMMSAGADPVTPVEKKTELEKKKSGDQISYELSLQMRMKPVRGQEKLAGREDKLRWSTANVYIDLVRGGIQAGDEMSEQRTLHDLRETAKNRQKEWWTRVFDEDFFMYAAGARGSNAGYTESSNYAGFANNPFVAPDAGHLFYGGSATAKANLAAGDIVDLGLIDKMVAKAKTQGGGVEGIPRLRPTMVDGKEHFVLVMNEWNAYDLRTNATTGQWLDIQKSAGERSQKKNPIFNGAMGMYNNVVLQCHSALVEFDDYGAGSNVGASRLLFLGRQALIVAFGNAGKGLSYDWHEELEDRGNEVVVTTKSMYGLKKNTFEIDGVSRDFGMFSADVAFTAAA